MPRRLANLALWMLAWLPVVIFLLTSSALHWQSAADILNTLGRLCGVAGISFMLVAAILSSRVPGFDRLFGGLTKLWQTHHRIASLSFLFVLIHPLLLAFSAVTVSVTAGVSLLFPLTNYLPTLLGWLALIAMMIFLAPSFSFFGEPKYQHWKLLHKLAAVALVLALIHAVMLVRQINYLWEYLLWGLYTALALLAFIYRWGFSRQLFFKRRGRLQYTVANVINPLPSVVEIELQPEGHSLSYEPGQFIYLTPYDRQLTNGYGQEHPYTISSSPQESNLRVAIKDLGDASHALQSIHVGSTVRIEGPYGKFFPTSVDEDSELWIAGGIGITPFLSRARHFAVEESEVDVHCFLCVQDETRALYRDELQAIAAQLPGFNLTVHYFYREGPLNADFVRRHCSNFKDRSCYVCGPPAMLACVQKFLRGAGVPKNRIHTEEFNLL